MTSIFSKRKTSPRSLYNDILYELNNQFKWNKSSYIRQDSNLYLSLFIISKPLPAKKHPKTLKSRTIPQNK